jgi:3-methyladenine DNA glycosylase AlkC
MATLKRKGAASTKDIPAAILTQLNSGQIETVNLVEWLAVDQRYLLKQLLAQIKRTKYLAAILADIDVLKKQTVNTINEAIGRGLLNATLHHKDTSLPALLAHHPSDIVRCWAIYTIAKNKALTTRQILEQIKPFAADKHFGVREIAWLAIRQTIIKNLDESLKILVAWTANKDENIRRFASEATRPRGVWCEHIEVLKQKPAVGLVIIEPLKSDPAKYVQDSVGNWLNDASKTQPAFVIAICKKWGKESKTKETDYIIKRALRTIEKNT